MKRTTFCLSILSFALFVGASAAFATEYFVDSYLGSDENAGTSEAAPWKTLGAVARAELAPGDVVRLRCGRVWRETLRPQSGAPNAPILYSSYGEGAKPRVMRSVDLSSPEDWERVGDRPIWVTSAPRWNEIEGAKADAERFAARKWRLYCESPAEATQTVRTFDELDGAKGVSIECADPGESSSRIQFIFSSFAVREGEAFALRFKARSSIAFDLSGTAALQKSGHPWSGYGSSLYSSSVVDSEWREYECVFKATQSARDARLAFFLGTRLPKGARFDFVPLDSRPVQVSGLELMSDVGNIILTDKDSSFVPADSPALKTFVPTWDKGERAGFKRWAMEELKEQDDFWYDESSRRVYFYSDVNPGERYASVELALREHACACSASDVEIEGIAFTHTAAHGVASGRNARVVVRDCDFDWIGGGDLSGQGGKGRRVRFGNGVEFWEGSEDCLVERCLFSRVYDVALTTQGREEDVSRNFVIRDNVIYRCEQAFEIWFSNKETILEGCVFERNLCVDCGRDWSHIQRPDKCATAILGYSLEAKVVDVTIRDNVFYDPAQYFVRCSHNRFDEYRFSNNVYWMRPDTEHYSGDRYFVFNMAHDADAMTYDGFKERGKDVDSRWMEPRFKDYAKDALKLTNRDELGAGPLE